MSTAAQQPANAIRKSYVIKNNAALVKGVGVIFDSGEVDVATAGTKVVGVATETITGDGSKRTEIIMLAGAATIKVKASGTATAGEYTIAGTDGFENLTAGGGTTVKHCCGVFLETGVDGDFVEMIPVRMPAVSS